MQNRHRIQPERGKIACHNVSRNLPMMPQHRDVERQSQQIADDDNREADDPKNAVARHRG